MNKPFDDEGYNTPFMIELLHRISKIIKTPEEKNVFLRYCEERDLQGYSYLDFFKELCAYKNPPFKRWHVTRNKEIVEKYYSTNFYIHHGEHAYSSEHDARRMIKIIECGERMIITGSKDCKCGIHYYDMCDDEETYRNCRRTDNERESYLKGELQIDDLYFYGK